MTVLERFKKHNMYCFLRYDKATRLRFLRIRNSFKDSKIKILVNWTHVGDQTEAGTLLIV